MIYNDQLKPIQIGRDVKGIDSSGLKPALSDICSVPVNQHVAGSGRLSEVGGFYRDLLVSSTMQEHRKPTYIPLR